MFAVMYSTQTILPELSRAFAVSPAQAGLTLSVVIVAVAVTGWVWGPVSDRIGRKRSLTLASALLAVPTLGAALAPSFGLLLFFRALQGICMPGLIIVGVPYVAEVFTPGLGGRAMGYYVAALVTGGVIGRVGVGLLTAAVGWRAALGALVVLPLGGTLLMRRTLPEAPPPTHSLRRFAAVGAQLKSGAVIRPAVAAAALFFTFVSVFSFTTYRLSDPPFDYGTATVSVLFGLWVMGAIGPAAGRLADRYGWRVVAVAGILLAAAGVMLSLPPHITTLAPALALIVLGMFTGVTAAQLGISAAGDSDRAVASSIYFTFYYGAGALAGFVPGLAWQHQRWPGVAVLALAALGIGLAALARAPSSR
jgi:YNFM family putative membrane transporter